MHAGVRSELTRDGYALSVLDWPLPAHVQARATVLLVHGLGEHIGRYDAVAQRLGQAGFAVRGYDHVGHGLSGGRRGDLPQADSLLADLGQVIDATRSLPGRASHPLILLGHSMGGLVVARAVAQKIRPVDGLVMSSPALAASTNAVQKLLLATLPRWFPHLCVDNGLNAQWVARSPQVVQAYLQDPLVHRKIAAGLAQWILTQGAQTVAHAPAWATPTLLLYAGTDRLVDPEGSARFAAQAPKDWVQAKVFEAMYHEIFNDPEAQEVFDVLIPWLTQRF
jgi:alpha-beta hydrolase superfamily lysophospholipase